MTQEEYIKSYPIVPYTESVDADKLAEGRIYAAETMGADSILKRSFICVKQVYPQGLGISLHFGVYFEIMVHWFIYWILKQNITRVWLLRNMPILYIRI